MNEKLPVLIEREIPKLNEQQLRLLNQIIVEKLKLLSKAKALHALSKFNISDIVSFKDYDEVITGRIIKINQKTVSIITLDKKSKWNVAPFLLKPENFYETENIKSKENNEEKVIIQNISSSPPNEKISRNAPCPCGSGKKFKYCCGKM